MKPQEIFEFGSYRLQPTERLLLRDGEPVPLTSRFFDLLVVLVENSGTLLERDHLLRTLWPDSFIEENNLTANVSNLRKLLAEDGGQTQYIETVPKRGYRFVAEVRHVSPSVEPDSSHVPPVPVAAPPNRALGIRPAYAIGLAVLVLVILGALGALRFTTADPPTGIEALPLTSYPGSEYSPSISPDGTRVAFAWEGPNGAVPGIYVKVIGAGDAIRLTEASESITDPVWSPDGTQIAAVRQAPETAAGKESQIVLMPAVGGKARKLAEIRHESEIHGNLLAWSSEGKWLMMSSRERAGAPLSIQAIPVEGGQKKPITSPPATYLGDGHPALSPDGRILVFSRNVTSIVGDYYLLELSPADLSSRGQPRRLTFFENQAGGITWPPDGREIVFSAGPALGGSRLFRLPITKTAKPGVLQPIPYVGIDGRAPVISRPSGRTQAALFMRRSPRSTVSGGWTYQMANQAMTRHERRQRGWTSRPTFPPTARKSRSRPRDLATGRSGTCEVTGLNCVQLTNFGRSFSRCPRWSPDGAQIVFDSRIGGNADIFVIGASGGKPRQLTTEPSNEILPSWSVDGRFIYFSSNRTGGSKIWKIPFAGGTASLVSEGTGEGAQESHDGKCS